MEFIRQKKSSLGIEMAPMIDVVFLLLIFFMLSSSFLNPALKLTLPQAASEDRREPEPLTVSIDQAGNIFLNTQKVPMGELKAELAAHLSGKDPKAVRIRGDAEMPYKLFVEVMDRARQAGAEQIHIAHQSSSSISSSGISESGEAAG